MSRLARRQKLRRGTIFGLFLLFPLIYNFFSPYLIVDGAAQGVASGSMVMFALIFVSSLVFGRAFCGWVCPAGGLQEACALAQPKAANNQANWTKWLIWFPWFGLIVFLMFSSGGIHRINLLHNQSIAGSADAVRWFGMYVFVAGTIFTLAMTAGRRAFCHYACWMAPFMMIGRGVRNRLRAPALQLVGNAAQCSDCYTCVRGCPMSLDVNALVHAASMEHSECILCGSCVDACAQGAIRYDFGVKRRQA